jgi:putative heme-binding domain-containing protein
MHRSHLLWQSILCCLIALSLGRNARAQSDPKLPFPQNRVRDFYSRQAAQLLNQTPLTGNEILPQFPGLDGGGFGHWGQNPEEVSFDHSLNVVDTGNVVCQLTHHFGQTTFKGVNVLLDQKSGTSVLYDPQKMTFIDAWQGGFVKWGHVRFGLMGGVSAAGERIEGLQASAWQTRPEVTHTYRGYYRHGQAVAFCTQIGSATVLDQCSFQQGRMVRTLQSRGSIPDHTFLQLAEFPAGTELQHSKSADGIRFVIGNQPASLSIAVQDPPASATLVRQDNAVGILFASEPFERPLRIEFSKATPGNDPETNQDDTLPGPTLEEFLAGGPGQWTTKVAQTQGVLGTSDTGFAIDTVTLPHGDLNPFRSALRIGGVGCLSDGRVVVATLMGEVWIVAGIQEMPKQPLRWQRIASGLYQALGVVIQKDSILVLGSDQITRLHDLNGDHEADYYECVTNAFPTTGGHDFCTSLQQDDQGTLYWAISSGDFGVAKMTGEGTIETLGNGLRNSNGIGVSRDGNVVLATVQEGTWTPASAIFEVRNHSYHGLKGPKAAHGKYGYDLPLCFIPRGVDNSSGEIGFLPRDARLGSLSGAAIGTSFGACQTYLVLRDVVNNQPQGAIVPLPGDYLSGVCRVAFGPADGCVYIGGTEGWQSYSQDDGCLHRLRITDKPLPLPTSFEAHNNGVVVRFSHRLDASSVKPGNVFCQQWNYLYSAGYGSPEFSVREPGIQGHDPVPVKAVHLLPDGQSVFLEIPQLHPVMQFHAHLQFRSREGEMVPPDLLASIYELRPDFKEFPGYAPVAKRRAPDFPIAEKYEQDPRLVKQEEYGTNFGWVSSSLKISVTASAGLQFEPRVLRVPPGSQVSLAFRNGDPSMPHNVAVVKADALDDFGEQSMQLASNPRAIATHYVPDSPAEICFSPILPPGDQYTLYFEAPAEPGEYRLVCTYPGHWRVMQGSLFVLPEDEVLPHTAFEPSRKFVQMWSTKDFESDFSSNRPHDSERGRRTFELAGCSKCHKVGSEGSALGPDLTKISERFKGAALLKQILEPSLEINKQHQTWVAALEDGRVIAGLMVEQKDDAVTLLPNPLKPDTRTTLSRSQIEELEPSLISTMPMNLLITFTREEILDLVAWLESGGSSSSSQVQSR